MAKWQWRQYGSMALSGENLGNICLLGTDYSVNHLIKPNIEGLNSFTTSYCGSGKKFVFFSAALFVFHHALTFFLF